MLKDHDGDGPQKGPAQMGDNGRGSPANLSAEMILETDHIYEPESDYASAPAFDEVETRQRIGSFSDRYGEWREHASIALSQLDLAPDLSREIGSIRWFRGAITLAGLSAIAIAFVPGFEPVEAAPAMQIDAASRDEFRSQMIMPLALGADSGRHMGATTEVVALQNAPERPSISLVATLARGDGFGRMLRRAGVGSDEAAQISALLAGAMPLEDIDPGTRVDITLGRRDTADAQRPVDSLSFRARFDLQLAIARSEDGRLVLDPRPIIVDATPLRVRGIVGESLYRSARAAGAPPSTVQSYLKTIGTEINLDSGVSATDEFDLIVDYKRAATGEVEAGDLLYAAILRDGKPRKQLMRWGKEGRFFEASGVGAMREGLIAPVPGRITSRFGMRRHPILGYRRMHGGLDFKARHGTPIYAATDGRVKHAGRKGSYGNYVRIQHEGNLATGYAHMSRVAVRNGAYVKRGQVIGYVGSTGLSTGAHLHYEMYRGSKKINPSSVKFVTRSTLSGSELASFRAQLAGLQSIEAGAALVSLAPDPSLAEEPVREIDRLENKTEVN